MFLFSYAFEAQFYGALAVGTVRHINFATPPSARYYNTVIQFVKLIDSVVYLYTYTTNRIFLVGKSLWGFIRVKIARLLCNAASLKIVFRFLRFELQTFFFVSFIGTRTCSLYKNFDNYVINYVGYSLLARVEK